VSKIWTCPQCAETTRFRGLCRSCSEYDADGNLVTAVRREKEGHVCSTGCHHSAPITMPTKESFVSARMKKPTKKQIKNYVEVMEAAALAPTIEGDSDFVEIGDEEE
tara:strand:- start:577 stop:897 length:321 start_codon:yes stop_codon:yes gene_type:complete